MKKCLRFTFFLFFLAPLFAIEPIPNDTLIIPMRDGTLLPTDIYLPSTEATEPLPCILLRSPYGRKKFLSFCSLVERGYVVAIQDTRNVVDNSGKILPYWCDGWGESKDGFDTIEWLASHELTNGKVATIGTSAAGIVQMLLAPSAPPSLACQYIGMAASSIYHQAVFHGGQLRKSQVEGWLGENVANAQVKKMVSEQIGYNEFWQALDANPVAHQVTVPAVHYGGWYDIFLQGTIEGYLARQHNGGEGAKGQQKLLIGPWQHFWPTSLALGDFEVPEVAHTPPLDISLGRWLDYHMKDEANGIDEIPNVVYYVMGPFDGTQSSGNVWRTTDVWPVPSQPLSMYLHPSLALKEAPGTGGNSQLNFVFDPKNPVPTIGGRNLFLEAGPKDQQAVEKRSDVLVFTSEPLKEDLEVTGRITVKLFVSSTSCDTDFVVRLCDLYPDGRSILITDGVQRVCPHFFPSAHPRIGHEGPIEIEVDLWSTSLVFAKGHSIRISVCGSNYPRYEINSNVTSSPMAIEQELKVAKNSIHIGKMHPSQLILPCVRKGENWLVQKVDSCEQ